MFEFAAAYFGFSAIGPVAGTLASNWMSLIATSKVVAVSTGWIYPAIQSAAMGGVSLGIAPVIAVSGLGAGLAATAGITCGAVSTVASTGVAVGSTILSFARHLFDK